MQLLLLMLLMMPLIGANNCGIFVRWRSCRTQILQDRIGVTAGVDERYDTNVDPGATAAAERNDKYVDPDNDEVADMEEEEDYGTTSSSACKID